MKSIEGQVRFCDRFTPSGRINFSRLCSDQSLTGHNRSGSIQKRPIMKTLVVKCRLFSFLSFRAKCGQGESARRVLIVVANVAASPSEVVEVIPSKAGTVIVSLSSFSYALQSSAMVSPRRGLF